MSNRLTRRKVLQIASLGSVDCAAMHAAPPILDTHVHFYDPNRPQGVPWPAKTDTLLYRPALPARYETLARPLGITGTVVVEASPWVEDNQWLLELAQEHSIIVGVVGHIEPGPEFASNLTRFTRHRLFRGVRLSGAATEARHFDDLRRLAAAGLTLDVIGGIAGVLLISDAIPALRIAVDHLPNEPAGWQAAMRELSARPQVFAKVSGVLRREGGSYREELDRVWETFGPGRVMYGSNWPVSDRVGDYAAVLGAVREYVPAKHAEAFFAGNARRCYGIA